MNTCIPLATLAALLAGCFGGLTNRVDVDSEDRLADTGTNSKDLRTVAETMARSIVSLAPLARAGTPPRIALLRVQNRSNELIDTQIITEKIRTLLVKNAGGRVIFVDRSDITVDALEAERAGKRAGVLTSTDVKTVSGVDFFLAGTLASLDKAGGGVRSTYTRFSFRLTDAESSDIIWEDEYEMKKSATTGIWDQ